MNFKLQSVKGLFHKVTKHFQLFLLLFSITIRLNLLMGPEIRVQMDLEDPKKILF